MNLLLTGLAVINKGFLKMSNENKRGVWPKEYPPLTSEQQWISDNFMHYWHQVLPKKYGVVDKFNHEYVVKNSGRNFLRTLEVGAGNGERSKYEDLNKDQLKNYFAFDLRQNMIDDIDSKYPQINALVGDCQDRINFPDGYFDRVIVIYVLEHLPNLHIAIRALYRLCDKTEGIFSIVIPCEGVLAYSLARKISAQRIFENRYKQSYDRFIEREYINNPKKIFSELFKSFSSRYSSYLPYAFLGILLISVWGWH